MSWLCPYLVRPERVEFREVSPVPSHSLRWSTRAILDRRGVGPIKNGSSGPDAGPQDVRRADARTQDVRRAVLEGRRCPNHGRLALAKALVYRRRDKTILARVSFDSARAALQNSVRREPDDYIYHA